MNDPHLGYIVASYVIGFGVIGALIAWTVIDHRLQSRALARMEARAPRRREGA
jgi:heme exporter protein D